MWSGTSFSAPLFAGRVAQLLVAADRGLVPRLRGGRGKGRGADGAGEPGPDQRIGVLTAQELHDRGVAAISAGRVRSARGYHSGRARRSPTPICGP